MALTTSEMQTLSSLVSKMDQSELKLLADLYNSQSRFIQGNMASTFRVGDKVKWMSKYGRTIEGTITKVNTKTIKVSTSSDGQWSVSPSLLKKA